MNMEDLEDSRPVAVDDAIPQAGRTGWRFALFVCFLVVVLDGFNTTSISFVVPTLAHKLAWLIGPLHRAAPTWSK